MTTYAALLTPPGRGAVATIVVDGPDATQVVQRHFCRAARSPDARAGRAVAAYRPRVAVPAPSNRLTYGHWGAGLNEEVVLRVCSQRRFEIHCHGGRAASAAILASLEQAGCRLLDWRAYAARSEANRIRAEAVEALAAAPTLRTAAILLDQLAGALEREVEGVEQAIGRIEEGERGREGEILDVLDGLLGSAAVGLHLVDPWKVVLAGRPNVGKSSLINALLGYERAITAPTPGTTRDVVSARAALGGWPVMLSDTAGLRKGAEELEVRGIERAQDALMSADLTVLVVDRSEPLDQDDRRLIEELRDAVCVANKMDLPAAEGFELPCAAFEVSALGGAGIDELAEQLAQRLVAKPPAAGAAVVFTCRQLAHLQDGRYTFGRRQWGKARRALRELIGDRVAPTQR